MVMTYDGDSVDAALVDGNDDGVDTALVYGHDGDSVDAVLFNADDVDAKQRCLPELHDVPYDTPPPSNSTPVAAAVTAVAAAASNAVRRTSHHELMDEPIYANAAAHPPIIGSFICILRCFQLSNMTYYVSSGFKLYLPTHFFAAVILLDCLQERSAKLSVWIDLVLPGKKQKAHLRKTASSVSVSVWF